ncbi:MAG: ABC transporter permease [Beijerinckiaceae bacterium]|nr:ABC transporter permease [Beijerinckiaceae bacterium]
MLRLIQESLDALRDGNSAIAADKAKQAQRLAPDNLQVAVHCIEILDETEFREELMAALLIGSDADLLTPAQHRKLSGLLADQGSMEAATRHALQASDGDPDNWEYARHCGVLLNFFGRNLDAANYLVRAAKVRGNDPLIFYHLSVAAAGLEHKTRAATFAAKAWQLEPDNFTFLHAHIHNLLETERHGEAVTCLEEALEAEPAHTVDLWYLLSVARNLAHDPSGAIDAATRGLAVQPGHTVLRLHRGIILCALGRYEDALVDMRAVLDIDPNHDDALRGSFAANTELGRYAEAVPFGAAVMRNKPDDESIGRTMLHILTRRYLVDGASPLDGNSLATLKRQAIGSRPARRKFTAFEAARTQFRVIGALILREIQGRFGRAKLGYLWALFEPLAHISLLVAIIQLTAKGDPPIGTSFALFYFTGIIPYHLFTHTGGALMFAIRANRQLLQLPPVTTLDVFVARAILEIVTEFGVAIILLLLFAIIGFNVIPYDILTFGITFLLIGGCAFGVGVINAIILSFFHTWEKIWSIVIAILYFTSGIFFVPSMMPVEIRQVLEWNPIFQGIELFRTSMFEAHNPAWLRLEYLTVVSVGLVVLGVVLERIFRHKLLEVE